MIKLYLTGGITNTEPNLSLGANPDNNTTISEIEITNDTLNNLFDNISFNEVIENENKEIIDYRVIGIKNYSTDFTSTDINIYFPEPEDEIIGDITITYEMALSKYKNYYSGFPPDGTCCRCIDEHTLPPNPECISPIFIFDKYTEEYPIYIDMLLPDEYILLYIKRKIIVGELSDFTCDECPMIKSFKIKIDWTEI